VDRPRTSRDPFHSQAREQWELLRGVGAKLRSSVPAFFYCQRRMSKNAMPYAASSRLSKKCCSCCTLRCACIAYNGLPDAHPRCDKAAIERLICYELKARSDAAWVADRGKGTNRAADPAQVRPGMFSVRKGHSLGLTCANLLPRAIRAKFVQVQTEVSDALPAVV